MNELVYAFVPARSGSKGLPDKNVLPIDGHPLMAYSIAFGQALGVDRVVVSTDSRRYADAALYYGAECPYLRGQAASSDTAMEEDIIADLAANLPRYGIPMPAIWLRLKPTNPFRMLEHAREAIDLLRKRPDVDAVRHVTKSETRLQIINSDGFLEPLSREWPANRSVIRRSEFVTAYQVFNLDVFRHNNWERLNSGYMGQRVYPIVGQAITGLDVNDADDFEIVKALIEGRPRAAIVERHIIVPGQAGYALH